MARDPIQRYRAWLIERNLVPESELSAIDADVQAKVDSSVEYARRSPKPDPTWGVKNVYANSDVAATQFYASNPVALA
jgi:pyruvate dehydrogenase E1 component alpha subunit